MPHLFPHLWFDRQAKDAANFYASLFPESKILTSATIQGTPSGDCDILTVELWGHRFDMISAGPYFKTNPSISFMVNFDPSRDPEAATRLEAIWKALENGGNILMPLGEYLFSKRYGWVEDKFGASWQLILTNPDGEPRPTIIPSMLFTQEKAGKAEEATEFYLSVFKNAKRGTIARYPAGMEPEQEGTIMFTDFQLENQWFAAMDSAQKHEFVFNEAISFVIHCDTQEEIDYYWEKLSAVPEAERCGWLKDKYGVSWQVTPTVMDRLMNGNDREAMNRVTQAFLTMKKFNIAELERAAK